MLVCTDRTSNTSNKGTSNKVLVIKELTNSAKCGYLKTAV